MKIKFNFLEEYWFPRVPPEERAGLQRELDYINFRRARLLAWFVLGLMGVLIPLSFMLAPIVIERPSTVPPIVLRDFIIPFVLLMRVVLAVMALMFLLTTKVLESPADLRPFHKYFTTASIFFGLICFTAISGVNIATTQQYINAYIIAIFATGTFFALNISTRALMFSLAWATVIVSQVVLGGESFKFIISGSTATILTILAMLTSQAVYGGFIREYLQKRTIELKNKELESTNIELKSFAHAASHDLRVPLALIREYCTMLNERVSKDPEGKTRRITLSIQSNCARMEALIADLLQFSRASRAEIERKYVDLSILARDVLNTLQSREPKREVEIHIESHLSAEGDAGLLRVALENLFANAWKYTRSCSPARITFGREPANGGGMAFFVRDNGVGFDMKYAENLFKPFVRLHGRDQYEGTGIGLATVRHIIERHNGRIWVDSAPNRGATFYFTLK